MVVYIVPAENKQASRRDRKEAGKDWQELLRPADKNKIWFTICVPPPNLGSSNSEMQSQVILDSRYGSKYVKIITQKVAGPLINKSVAIPS